MKRRIAILLLLLLSAVAATVAQDVKRVAILETVDRGGNVPLGVKIMLRQSITFAINQVDGYEGYNRVDMAQINKEHEFQRTGYVSDADIKALGEMTGASYILVAEAAVYDAGSILVLANLVDVVSGKIVNSSAPEVAGTEAGKMSEVCAKVAKNLLGVSGGGSAMPPSKQRTSVETLYGYLHIFPNEIGEFQSEPTMVISRINTQAQHGYNNWRLPTNEELALMRANNYLKDGEYMTRENPRGIVLLVTDGEDYATIQAKEEQRKKAEAEKQRIEAEKQRKAEELKRQQGFVDLGLPSRTKWNSQNESGGLYTYEQAVNRFGSKLPTKEQLEELKNSCSWQWTGSGYIVTGSNGNSIFLPAAGYRFCDGYTGRVGSDGYYLSSTPSGSDKAWYLFFDSSSVNIISLHRCYGPSVRLVQ